MDARQLEALLGGTGLAVVIGLGSAAAFAGSNALQHRVAGTVPASAHRASEVLRHLARQPVWLVATGISTLAVGLHATAMRFGSIALVQPLMLVGVVLAVPVRAALERSLPRWVEVRAVIVTAAGLALFLVAVNPEPSDRLPGLGVTGAFAACCFAVTFWLLRASGHRGVTSPARQAALLGIAAGLMFGVTAGLLKVVGTILGDGHPDLPALAAAGTGLVAAGLVGTALNQKAYQVAPLSRSLPVVNVVDLVVAVLFGAVVFGEVPGHSVVPLALEAVAIAVVALGLRLIAALPVGGSEPVPSVPSSEPVGGLA